MYNQYSKQSPLIEDPWEVSDVTPTTIPQWQLDLPSYPLITSEPDQSVRKLPVPQLMIPMLLEDELKIKGFGDLLQGKMSEVLGLLYWFETVKQSPLAENLG